MLTTQHKEGRYEMVHRALELAGSCEHGKKSTGSAEGKEFLD
jgi:hypothetical protein